MDSHGICGVYVPSLWLEDHVELNQGFLALGVNAIPYMHGPGGAATTSWSCLDPSVAALSSVPPTDIKTFVKIPSLFIERGSNPPSERFQCSKYLLSTSCERTVLASKRTRNMPVRFLTVRMNCLQNYPNRCSNPTAVVSAVTTTGMVPKSIGGMKNA